MAGKAMFHNFRFNQYIIKSLMLFLIFRIENQITVNIFRAGADVAPSVANQIVFLAKILVCFALANGLASHIPNAHKVCTIGEKVTNLGFSQPSNGCIERVSIKMRIVGGHIVNVKRRANMKFTISRLPSRMSAAYSGILSA